MKQMGKNLINRKKLEKKIKKLEAAAGVDGAETSGIRKVKS